jgi:hypothetical protein
MIVQKQVEIAVVVVIDGPPAVEVGSRRRQQRKAGKLIDVGKHIPAVIPPDFARVSVGSHHEQIEIAVVVEIMEFGAVAVGHVLRAI